MMKYKTKEGEVLQGGTSSDILKAYQKTSKFDVDRTFEEYLRIMWRRIEEWQPRGKKEPEDEYLVTEVFAGLVLNGFLTEVK